MIGCAEIVLVSILYSRHYFLSVPLYFVTLLTYVYHALTSLSIGIYRYKYSSVSLHFINCIKNARSGLNFSYFLFLFLFSY